MSSTTSARSWPSRSRISTDRRTVARRATGSRTRARVEASTRSAAGSGTWSAGTVDADLASGQARPPGVLGELHGPGGAGLPVAVAQGDPRTRQTQIGGVVVGGVKVRFGQRDGRGARHQARQVGQSEPGWRHELGLALDSCSRGGGLLPHLGDDRRVPAHPTGPKDPPGPPQPRRSVRRKWLIHGDRRFGSCPASATCAP